MSPARRTVLGVFALVPDDRMCYGTSRVCNLARGRHTSIGMLMECILAHVPRPRASSTLTMYYSLLLILKKCCLSLRSLRPLRQGSLTCLDIFKYFTHLKNIYPGVPLLLLLSRNSAPIIWDHLECHYFCENQLKTYTFQKTIFEVLRNFMWFDY